MRFKPLILTIIVVGSFVGQGCLFETSDTVPFSGGALSDADSDVSTDATSSALYPEDTLPNGQRCSGSTPSSVATPCNPVTQDCARGEICRLTFTGGDPEIALGCRPDAFESEERATSGQSCGNNSSQKCAPGFRCVNVGGEDQICLRLCRYDDALGCEPSEYCDPRFGIQFGICVDSASMCL